MYSVLNDCFVWFAVTGKLWPKLYEIKLQRMKKPFKGNIKSLCMPPPVHFRKPQNSNTCSQLFVNLFKYQVFLKTFLTCVSYKIFLVGESGCWMVFCRFFMLSCVYTTIITILNFTPSDLGIYYLAVLNLCKNHSSWATLQTLSKWNNNYKRQCHLIKVHGPLRII